MALPEPLTLSSRTGWVVTSREVTSYLANRFPQLEFLEDNIDTESEENYMTVYLIKIDI